MPTQIYVNLAVNNLNKFIEFFTQLGFTFIPQFTDDTATCMIIIEIIFVMLLTESKFKTFNPKPYAMPQITEVLICMSCDSRADVDEMVQKAVAAGGTIYNPTFRTPPGKNPLKCMHQLRNLETDIE